MNGRTMESKHTICQDRMSFLCILALAAMLSIVSCDTARDKPQETPWGTTIGMDEADDDDGKGSSHNHSGITLDDIIANGEIIVGTMPGPETYYQYRGMELGTQYTLFAMLAKKLGIAPRVETSSDTALLAEKLRSGQIDILLLPQTAADKPNWRVSHSLSPLADTISRWYSPAMLAQARQASATATRQASVVTRHVYAPVQNKTKGIISAYDHLFRRYAPTAGFDWRLLAAQCYQESCFDPNARSYVGACGLMQIMPATARRLSLPQQQIFDPERNIAAAAAYIRQVSSHFADIRNSQERIKFTLAAYNCGNGHVRDAMALARKNGRDPQRWSNVAHYMMMLMQPEGYRDPVVRYGYMRATETVGYVENIIRRYRQYSGIALTGVSSGPSSGAIPQRATKRHKYKI